ncbi:hypothetical protein M8J77_021986 [Diaphorina citri]|nr:hypothetical protein M8J77_021986 [Diaphorina citri]
MDVMTLNVKDEAPWCMMFADDVILAGESASILTRKLERWREELENRGIKISRSKKVHMKFGSELKDDERVKFDGGRRNFGMCGQIQISRIDSRQRRNDG